MGIGASIWCPDALLGVNQLRIMEETLESGLHLAVVEFPPPPCVARSYCKTFQTSTSNVQLLVSLFILYIIQIHIPIPKIFSLVELEFETVEGFISHYVNRFIIVFGINAVLCAVQFSDGL